MIKKTAITILSLSIFALSACSEEKPQFSEELRKIGSPIEGKWQIADFDACTPDVKDRTIIITPEQIELVNETSKNTSETLFAGKTEKTSGIIFANMKQLLSTRFIMLSGEINMESIQGQHTLAYNDEGDKLAFAGFIVDNKLLKRKELLEKYNADGKAARNVAVLDFNFCSKPEVQN